MVEVGCGTIATMDQDAGRVCRAPSMASDGHNGNVEEITEPLVKRGRALRRYLSKVMEVKGNSNMKRIEVVFQDGTTGF